MKAWLVVCLAVVAAGCQASPPPPGLGPVTIQPFTIANIEAPQVFCDGAYTRVYGTVRTAAAVSCDDGRTGKLRLDTKENGHPVAGVIHLSDGDMSSVAFLPDLTEHRAYGRAPSLRRARHARPVVVVAPVYRLNAHGRCTTVDVKGRKVYVHARFCK